MGQGLAFTSGMFDVGQVEVLKGPQSLFYGKSAPGGVISLRTADPTNKFELIARVGYEFEAKEKLAELIASGPITDTLRVRVAGRYDQPEGYFHNVAIPAPNTGAKAPRHDVSAARSWIFRPTVIWEPTSNFSARLKVNLTHDRVYFSGAGQMVSCPEGVRAPAGIPFLGGGEDCKLDRDVRIVEMDPAAFPTIYNDGAYVLNAAQQYGSLELNWHPVREITVTSVTGYYHVRGTNISNGTNTTFPGRRSWCRTSTGGTTEPRSCGSTPTSTRRSTARPASSIRTATRASPPRSPPTGA
jgi:iron complex outermembrane receptor protein